MSERWREQPRDDRGRWEDEAETWEPEGGDIAHWDHNHGGWRPGPTPDSTPPADRDGLPLVVGHLLRDGATPDHRDEIAFDYAGKLVAAKDLAIDRLATALAADPDFVAFAGRHHGGDVARGVRAVKDAWAGDISPLFAALNAAAVEVFGVDRPTRDYGTAGVAEDDRPALAAFLRASHRLAADDLRAAGLPEVVRLWRGVSRSDRGRPQGALSSWTAQRRVAGSYADNYHDGAIEGEDIPLVEIVGTPRTALGDYTSAEFVVARGARGIAKSAEDWGDLLTSLVDAAWGVSDAPDPVDRLARPAAAEHWREQPRDYQGRWTEARRASFADFFGASRVVDAEGKPRVAYHGTQNPIEAFRAGHAALYGRGIYFTTDPTQASTYAYGQIDGQVADGANVLPVYLRIEHPADYDTLPEEVRALGREDLTQHLQALGFDGVRKRLDDDHDYWVAFDPTQVKSAIGNDGGFRRDHPDLRKSLFLLKSGGTVKRPGSRGGKGYWEAGKWVYGARPAARTPHLGDKLGDLREEIARAAQAIVDEWQQDDEGFDEVYGAGGACDEVARKMTDIIYDRLPGVEVVEGGQDGDDHAWLIAYDDERAYGVDIPPGVYETGGGYTWRKIDGARIAPGDVAIWPIDRDDIREMTGEADDDWVDKSDRPAVKRPGSRGGKGYWHEGEWRYGERPEGEIVRPDHPRPVAVPQPTKAAEKRAVKAWKPVMTREQADTWAASSAYPHATWHVLNWADDRENVERNGLSANYDGGSVWGRGVYVATDEATRDYYLARYGAQQNRDGDADRLVVETRVRVERPLEINLALRDIVDDFEAMADHVIGALGVSNADYWQRLEDEEVRVEEAEAERGGPDWDEGYADGGRLSGRIARANVIDALLTEHGYDSVLVVDDARPRSGPGGSQIMVPDKRRVTIVKAGRDGLLWLPRPEQVAVVVGSAPVAKSVAASASAEPATAPVVDVAAQDRPCRPGDGWDHADDWLVGVHFSPRRLDTVDPAYMGMGRIGPEAAGLFRNGKNPHGGMAPGEVPYMEFSLDHEGATIEPAFHADIAHRTHPLPKRRFYDTRRGHRTPANLLRDGYWGAYYPHGEHIHAFVPIPVEALGRVRDPARIGTLTGEMVARRRIPLVEE